MDAHLTGSVGGDAAAKTPFPTPSPIVILREYHVDVRLAATYSLIVNIERLVELDGRQTAASSLSRARL